MIKAYQVLVLVLTFLCQSCTRDINNGLFRNNESKKGNLEKNQRVVLEKLEVLLDTNDGARKLYQSKYQGGDTINNTEDRLLANQKVIISKIDSLIEASDKAKEKNEINELIKEGSELGNYVNILQRVKEHYKPKYINLWLWLRYKIGINSFLEMNYSFNTALKEMTLESPITLIGSYPRINYPNECLNIYGSLTPSIFEKNYDTCIDGILSTTDKLYEKRKYGKSLYLYAANPNYNDYSQENFLATITYNLYDKSVKDLEVIGSKLSKLYFNKQDIGRYCERYGYKGSICKVISASK